MITRRKFIGTAAASAAGLSVSGGAEGALIAAQDLSSLGKTPHTKFAVNVEMWWNDLPFLDRLEKTAQLGYPAVELWAYEDKDLDAIRKSCDRLGLEIAQFTAWGFKPGMNDPKNHDRLVEKIKESCEVAKRLNTKLACVVGGDDQPGMTQEEMHQNIIRGLRLVAPIVEKAGLTLILEPMNIRVDHKGHCLYGSAPTIRICKEVDSPNVKINWDLYHMHITEGDLCGHLREGFDYVGYLQLADHPGRNEPGTGEIHYNRVLKEAYDLGYRGFVGLECIPKEGPVEAAKRVALADQW